MPYITWSAYLPCTKNGFINRCICSLRFVIHFAQVLTSGVKSFESDVYSSGMVFWEILTRKVPWADEDDFEQIVKRVVYRKERPEFPAEAPADLVDIIRACWTTEPEERPTFTFMKQGMESHGWREA